MSDEEQPPEIDLWMLHPTIDAGVQALPPELKELLKHPEAARLCSNWLQNAHPAFALRKTAGEAVFQWDMVGMFLASQQRWFEAISVHRELYGLMCEAQEGFGWIHKGLPLVRLRDWHRRLGHPWHAERYLLLTLVEDAIADQGKIDRRRRGVYYRCRWEDGWSDEEFRRIEETCWKSFNEEPDMREFPEEIARRVDARHLRAAATPAEADLYEINIPYASRLFQRAAKEDWKALERLAAYELGCIPGFEVELQKRSLASVFDVFVRVRGSYSDFRRDFGTYMLGECKNWQKPVDTETVAYLAQNLALHECPAGILFSQSGISGSDELRYAALTVLRAYHHSGRIILVLNQTDFKMASQGESLQEILRRVYEQVRFDLPPSPRQ